MTITDEFLRESNAIEGVFDDLSWIDARMAWEYLCAEATIALNLAIILKTHKILMLHQPLRPNEKGYIRTVDVRVGPRICPAPRRLRFLLDNWIIAANDSPITENRIIRDHVAFENIHPFVDGNGRIGRMLLNWQRIKNGFDILVISVADRREYYELFR